MIRVSQCIGDSHRVSVLTEFIDESVCLSIGLFNDDVDNEVACGEMTHVSDAGVTIWHMGEARLVGWEQFDTVELFPHV